MNEQEAIARLKKKDIDALTLLMECYQAQAVKTAILITRDYELAHDVVQAVFLRLYHRSHLLDPQRPFKPYLMRSVVNAAINAAHKQQRWVAFDDSIDSEALFANTLSDGDPQKMLEDAEKQETVRRALDQLSPKQRAVIVMRYYLDMDVEEIAHKSKEPNGTIKWRLHAARQRLRGLLGWEV